jgi:hypothetical protein
MHGGMPYLIRMKHEANGAPETWRAASTASQNATHALLQATRERWIKVFKG